MIGLKLKKRGKVVIFDAHEDVPKQMAQALMSAEYFREFDGVLRKVLADWELTNA